MNNESINAIIRLIAMVAVPALTAVGWAVDVDSFVLVVGGLISIGTIVWGWWKNNNVTTAAQQAQIYLNELKADE